MPFKKFIKQFISSNDLDEPTNLSRVINIIQGNIEDSINSLLKIQNDSTVLTNISLIAGQTNIINHTLNRKLVGWNVIRKRDTSIDIWDVQDTNLSPHLTLLLRTGVDAVVDILVF